MLLFFLDRRDLLLVKDTQKEKQVNDKEETEKEEQADNTVFQKCVSLQPIDCVCDGVCVRCEVFIVDHISHTRC